MKKNDQTLELSADEMRRLGYEVIDILVEHYESVSGLEVKKQVPQKQLEKLVLEPPPAQGSDPGELIRYLRDEIFIDIEHKIHPRDFAFIPGPANFVSVLADTLASGYNIFSGAQITSTGATLIEKQVIDWLRELFGFGTQAGGLFVSGGSAANLTGLAAARHVKLHNRTEKARVYFSDQTHVSNVKALKLLGFSDENMCTLASNEFFQLELSELQTQIDNDRKNGLNPFCVIGNAGTTNTGAVDAMEPLADLCATEGLWLHVDGAFGAAAALCESTKYLLSGMNRVDSLSFDPHKWFFQPYEIGGILIRDMGILHQTFSTNAEYLRDIQDPEKQETNYFDYGIQMTRGFRALKMWLSIKTFGFDGMRHAINRGIELAELTEKYLSESDMWEIVTPAQLGIITFRYVSKNLSEERIAEVNEEIVRSMLADGFAFVLSTSLRGRTVLRMCTINPRTTDEDIRETLNRLASFGKQALK